MQATHLLHRKSQKKAEKGYLEFLKTQVNSQSFVDPLKQTDHQNNGQKNKKGKYDFLTNPHKKLTSAPFSGPFKV